jgi:hypothetical protein
MRSLAVVLALVVAAPLAVAAPRPRNEVGVRVATASDTSPGTLATGVRARHADVVRRALLEALHRSGADVRRAGEPLKQIDVSIIAWRVASAAERTDVSTELRVVICDGHGRMLAIVTGRAKISAPGRNAPIAELREQALAEAVGGITRSLQSQLERANS